MGGQPALSLWRSPLRRHTNSASRVPKTTSTLRYVQGNWISCVCVCECDIGRCDVLLTNSTLSSENHLPELRPHKLLIQLPCGSVFTGGMHDDLNLKPVLK